jgi:TP901 family phage tail tape measure protein
MANINAQFNYSANFGPVIGQMQKLTAEANLLNNTLQNLDKQSVGLKSNLAGAFASDLGKIGGYNAKMVELTDSVDQFGQSLLKQKLTLKEYAKEAIGAFTKSSNAHKLAVREVAREMSQLVTLGKGMDGKQMGMMITPATINLKDFNTQLAVSQKQWSIFNALVQDGTTHLINFGKNTQWAGRQITVGLTVPLTIYGNAVSKIFREVDAELTRFQKVYGSDLMNTTSNATEKMVDDVRNLAIEFSKSFGIAAKETASLAADLAATGLEGQKLLASLRETTRLAVLGDVSNQDAMKTTLSLQNAFKISTDELASSVNFLNAVENQTSLSLQDLTTAIPKAGPVVKALGGDVKDLALLMVALKEGGISAAEGANALKSGMASLINPTKQASITAKQYGIDINGIVQANRGQLMPTIIAFQQQLQLLDDFGKAQVIENVFGKYQFARISALFDNLNASASQTNAVLGLMGKSNKELAATAYQEMDTLMNSSSKRFQRAIEGIKAEFISIGSSITSSITPILENVTSKIAKAIEFFQNLPKPVKSFIKVATGLTAIAGPIIMMVGIFSNFLGYIGKGAMGMVNLGRRMAGIPTQKFEMLTDTQIMAQKATNELSLSFDRERSSVERLNQALGIYKQNLADAISLNPAFVNRQMPLAAPTTPQLRMGGRMPGYSNNSSAWVPGSGDGDKVPAMLEPGEYVVNKKAAAKYSGTLDQINYQSAPRFQKGGRMPGYADTSTTFNYDATYPYDGFKLDQSKHLVLANGKVMLKADYDRISSQGGRLPVLMRDDMNPYLNEKYEPSLRYNLGGENPFVGPLPQVSYQAMGRAGVGGSRNVYGYPFKTEQEAGVFSTLNSTTFGANQGGSKTSNIARSINDPQQQAYADWIAGHNTNQFRAGTGVMKRLQMEGHREQMLNSMSPISQSIPLFRGTVLKEKGANEFSGVGARELLMYIKNGMFEKAMGKKIQWSDMQSFSTIPDISNYNKFIESWTNPSNTNSKKAVDRQLESMAMLPVIFRLASAQGQTGFNISSKAMVQEVMGSPVDEKEWVLNNPSGTITGIRQDMGTKHHIIDLMQKGGRVQSHAEESKDLSEAFETYKIGYSGYEPEGHDYFELIRDYGKGAGASVTLRPSDVVKNGWLIDKAFSSGAPQTAIVELMVQARKMVQEQGGDLSIRAIKNEGSYSTFSAPMLLAAERMGLISFSEEEKLQLSGANQYTMQDFLDGKDPEEGIQQNISTKQTAEAAITASLKFVKGFKPNKRGQDETVEKIDPLPNWKKEFLRQKSIPLKKQMGGRIQSHQDESFRAPFQKTDKEYETVYKWISGELDYFRQRKNVKGRWTDSEKFDAERYQQLLGVMRSVPEGTRMMRGSVLNPGMSGEMSKETQLAMLTAIQTGDYGSLYGMEVSFSDFASFASNFMGEQYGPRGAKGISKFSQVAYNKLYRGVHSRDTESGRFFDDIERQRAIGKESKYGSSPVMYDFTAGPNTQGRDISMGDPSTGAPYPKYNEGWVSDVPDGINEILTYGAQGSITGVSSDIQSRQPIIHMQGKQMGGRINGYGDDSKELAEWTSGGMKGVRGNLYKYQALTNQASSIPAGIRLGRGTVLNPGLSKELSAEQQTMLLAAIQSGDYSSVIGKELNFRGLNSFSESSIGAKYSTENNYPISRFMDNALAPYSAVGQSGSLAKAVASELKVGPAGYSGAFFDFTTGKNTKGINAGLRSLNQLQETILSSPSGRITGVSSDTQKKKPIFHIQGYQSGGRINGYADKSLSKKDLAFQTALEAGVPINYLNNAVLRFPTSINQAWRNSGVVPGKDIIGALKNKKLNPLMLFKHYLGKNINPSFENQVVSKVNPKNNYSEDAFAKIFRQQLFASHPKDEQRKIIDQIYAASAWRIDKKDLIGTEFEENIKGRKLIVDGVEIPIRGTRTLPAQYGSLEPFENLRKKKDFGFAAPGVQATHVNQSGSVKPFRLKSHATETTSWDKKAAAPKAYAGVLQGIPNWATKANEYNAIVSALQNAGVPQSDRLASFYIQDVLAHINPSTTNANGIYEKVWSAANLMKDSQVYNVFLETLNSRKDIGGLLNPSTVSRVAGASGLPMPVVQAELTKIADGVHPNTANGAKVMMTLARMFPSRTSPGMPIAVAAGMGARLQGNFYDTLGQRALPSSLPNTTVRAYDPKGTGAPTSTTQGSRTASSGIVMPSGAIRPGMVMPNIQSIPSAAGGFEFLPTFGGDPIAAAALAVGLGGLLAGKVYRALKDEVSYEKNYRKHQKEIKEYQGSRRATCGDSGGIIASGRPCSNPVDNLGERCYLHKKQPMTDEQAIKLTLMKVNSMGRVVNPTQPKKPFMSFDRNTPNTGPFISRVKGQSGGTGTSATVKVDGMGNVLSNGIDDMVANTIMGQPIAVSSKELLAIGPNGGIAGVTSPGDEARGKIVHPMGTALMRGGKFKQQRLKGFADESMTEPVYQDQISGGRMDNFGRSMSLMIGGFNSVRYALEQYTSETNYATDRVGKFTAKMNLAVQAVSMASQLAQDGGAQRLQSFGRAMDFSQIDAQNRDPAMIARIEQVKKATARLQSIYEAQGVEDAETRAKTKGAGAVFGARMNDLVDNKGYSPDEAQKLMQNRINFDSGKITSKLPTKVGTGLGKLSGMLGGGLAKLGGPGPMMALQVGVMAVTKAVEIYQAEMVKAREAGSGAFKEPLETAKLLGVELKSLTADTERYAKFAETLFGSQGRGAYDKVFAETVRKDYGDFLDILGKSVTKQEQMNQLTNVYSNLIQRGMDPKNARDLTAEIARQGLAMTAFNEIQNSFSLKDTPADAMKMQTQSLESQIGVLQDRSNQFGVKGQWNGQNLGELQQSRAMNEDVMFEALGATGDGLMDKAIRGYFGTKGPGGYIGGGGAITSLIAPFLLDAKTKEQIAAQIGATLKGAFAIAAQDPVASNEAVNAIVANFKNADTTKIQEEVGKLAEEFGFGDLTNTGMFIDSGAFTSLGTESQSLFLNALKAGLGPELDKMLADGDLSPEEESALKQKTLEAMAIMKIDVEIDLQIDETTKQLQSVQDELNKLFDVALKGKQEEIVAEDKRHENAMKNLDNESQRLNDKKQLLQRNTDYYIKELQREKQAEDYYAGQRDTALQGLSAISQGDVFGFIGAQMKAASTADQFGRDRSIESIQETADIAQQKLDDELKAVDLRKQAESERHALEIANINLEIEALNKKKATASGDIQKAIKLLEEAKALQGSKDPEVIKVYNEKIAQAYQAAGTAIDQAKEAAGFVDKTGLSPDLQKEMDTAQKDTTKALDTFYKDTDTAMQYIANGGEGGWDILLTGMSEATKKIFDDTAKSLNIDANSKEFNSAANFLAAAINSGTTMTLNGYRIVTNSSNLREDNVKVKQASGGYISGPGTGTSDSIPAMLSNGEYVVNASAVKAYGPQLMNSINAKKFAVGGMVGSMPSASSAPGFAGGGSVPMPTISAPSSPKYNIPSAGGGMAPSPIAQMARGGMMNASSSDNSSSYNFNFNGAGMDMVMSHVNKAVGGRISSNSRRIG